MRPIQYEQKDPFTISTNELFIITISNTRMIELLPTLSAVNIGHSLQANLLLPL